MFCYKFNYKREGFCIFLGGSPRRGEKGLMGQWVNKVVVSFVLLALLLLFLLLLFLIVTWLLLLFS